MTRIKGIGRHVMTEVDIQFGRNVVVNIIILKGFFAISEFNIGSCLSVWPGICEINEMPIEVSISMREILR